MIDFLSLLACALMGLLRSRARLEAEILVLRHQLNVLSRKAPKRVAFNSIDRLVLAGLYRLAPGVLDALKTLKPETVIRWHRAGFRSTPYPSTSRFTERGVPALRFYPVRIAERPAGALRISYQVACIAAFTFAGVYGIERSRTPVASNAAFEIAAGITAAVISPAPHGFSVGRSIRSITISGTCGT